MKKIFAALAALAVVVALLFATPALADGGNSPEPCVPKDAWTEVIEHEAETHTEQVFDYWQRYSWTGGPHESDNAPVFPSEDWQPNVKGDPHGVGEPGAYFRSHGNSGKGDWFYLEAVYKTVIVVDKEAWTETIEHPAVTCEDPEPPVCGDEDYIPVGDECEEEPELPECMNEPKGCNETVCQLEPETCSPPVIGTPETETRCSSRKCVKIVRDGDKIIDREVIVYPADVREEGL